MRSLITIFALALLVALPIPAWSQDAATGSRPSVDRLTTDDFEAQKKQEQKKVQPKIAPSPSTTPSRTPSPVAGQKWTEPVTGIEFVWVPGGCYEMGCGSWTSDCDDDEKPVHPVCVDGFWMGKTEVTQGQWKKLMGKNPSKYQNGDNYPVETVSWNDAKEFIGKLKSMSGGKYEFRLPTEAEWEYACRSGGKAEKYAGGSDPNNLAWYAENNRSGTLQLVGTKVANGLGLYDMSGNVWEWCEDLYSAKIYGKHQGKNPVVTEDHSGGSSRVIRGGG
jgi:formylglycine-generating enzyme required for sulfatase activity